MLLEIPLLGGKRFRGCASTVGCQACGSRKSLEQSCSQTLPTGRQSWTTLCNQRKDPPQSKSRKRGKNQSFRIDECAIAELGTRKEMTKDRWSWLDIYVVLVSFLECQLVDLCACVLAVRLDADLELRN